jgi:hypothetical protein
MRVPIIYVGRHGSWIVDEILPLESFVLQTARSQAFFRSHITETHAKREPERDHVRN